MDKKSLVAFVMTAPVMSVFASNWGYTNDVDGGLLSFTLAPNFSQGNWTSDNSSLPDPTDETNPGSDSFVVISNLCPGISSSFTLPQGDYVLNYNGLKNAVISVKVGAEKAVEYKAGNANASFTVKSQSSVTVSVKPIKAMETWTVPTLAFNFQFNFKNAYNSLNTVLNQINNGDPTLTQYGEDGLVGLSAGPGIKNENDARKSQIAALKARFTNLQNEYKALQPQVAAVNYQANTVSGKLETVDQVCTRLLASYNTYQLYNNPNTIAPELNELLDNLGNYRIDVAAENVVLKAIADNNANLKAFTNKTTGYYDQITNNLKTATDGFKNAKLPANVKGQEKAYLEYIAANAKNNINNALNNLKAAVTAAYADMQNPDVDFVSLKNQAESILNQIAALADGYTGAQNDWAAYGYFLAAAGSETPSAVAYGSLNLADVELVQTAAFQKIDQLGTKNYTGFGQLYSDLISKYKGELNKIYKGNRGYTINPEGGLNSNNPNIAGASLNYPNANSSSESWWGMEYRSNNMPGVAQEFQNLVTLQDGAYADAQATISGVTVDGSSISEVLGVLTSPGFGDLAEGVQKDLTKLIGKIQSTYNALNSTVSTLYKGHILGVSENDGVYTFNGGYTKALNNFNNAVRAYVNYLNGTSGDLKATLEIMGDYSETEAYVDDKFSDLKYGDTLEGIFDDSFDKLGGWVDDYIKQLGEISKAKAKEQQLSSEVDEWQEELYAAEETVAKDKPATGPGTLNDLEAKLNAAKQDARNKKDAYYSQMSTLTEEELAPLKEAWLDAEEVATAAQDAVNELKKDIETAKGSIKGLQDNIDANIQGVLDARDAQAAAEAKRDNIKSSIEAAIKDIKKNADLLHDTFQPVENNLTGFSTAANELQKDVNAVSGKVVTVTVSGNPAYTYKAADASSNVKVGNTTKAWSPADFTAKASELNSLLASIASQETVKIGSTTYDCENPTEFLNAANALNAVWNNDGTTFTQSVNAARLKLAKAIADANLAAINELEQVLTYKLSWLKQVNAPGAANITVQKNFDANYDGFGSVEEASNAVASATTVNAYANADKKMIAFAKAYQTSLETVKPVYDNYMSWRELRNALGLGNYDTTTWGVDGYIGGDLNPVIKNQPVSTELLQQATDYVNVITDATAKPYYLNLLKALSDEITAEGDKVTGDYKDLSAATNYKTLLAEINAINAKIKKVETDCLANQQKYGALSSEVDKLSQYANTVADYISNNDEVDTNKKEYLDKIAEEVNKLKTLSTELTNSFKNGAVVADDAAAAKNYTGRLADIKKALSDIEAGENATYKQAVIDANNAFLAKRGMTYDYLYGMYKAAVDKVNAYRYDIKNAGYYAALVTDEEFQKAHYAVQQEYLELEDFNTTYGPWFDSLTAGSDRSKWVVLATFVDPNGADVLKPAKMPSAQDQKKITEQYDAYVKAAKTIRDNITTKEAAVTDIAYGIAQTYFDTNFTNSGKLNYENTRAALVAAGLTDLWTSVNDPSEVYEALSSEALNNMYGAYWNIQEIYNALVVPANTDPKKFVADPEAAAKVDNKIKPLKDASKYDYILGMSAVADNIDDLIPTVPSGLTDAQFVAKMVNTGVANTWTSNINDLLKELQGYQEKAQEDAGYGKPADIAKAIEGVNSVNAEWNAYVVPASDCAKEYKNYLAKIDKAAKTVLDKARKYALDTESQAVKASLIGTTAAGVIADLNNLLDNFGYHNRQIGIYDDYLAQINAIVDEIKGYDGVPDKAAYEKKFSDLKKEINSDAAYQAMFTAECAYAQDVLISKVKTAFNDANVKGVNVDNYIKTIQSYEEAVGTYAGTPVTAANAKDLMSKLRQVEDSICKTIVDLEDKAKTPADKTAVQVALTDFNAAFTPANAEVTNALDAVNEAASKSGDYSAKTAAKFAPQFEALKAQLDAIKGQATPSDSFIYGVDKLKFELAQIQQQAKDLKAAWDAQNAQDVKFFASDELYAEYTAELDGLLKNVETAHALLLENKPEAVDAEYTTLLNTVNQAKTGLRAKLEEGKKNHSFVKGETDPVEGFNAQSTAYVKSTLEQVFKIIKGNNSKAIWEEYVAVFENENLNSDNGWKLDYVNAAELMEKLLAQKTKIDSLNTDPAKDPIYKIYNTETKKWVDTDSDEAVAGYEALIAQMDAIMAEVDNLVNGPVGEKYLKGDVNNDGDLTVADVQKLIDMVGEGVKYESGNIESETADVNGDNAINIADVTALINRVLNEQNTNKPNKLSRNIPSVSGNNSFTVEEIMGENGLRRFVVVLNNEVDFVSGQLDIQLPASAYVAGVKLAERANGLESFVFENNGFTRVLLTALDNEAAIAGNNGALLYIDVEGDAEIEVENLIFSDANANAYDLSNGTTGVGIIDSMIDGVKSIYNAAGQKLRNLSKGVNIIRNADGTTTKKMGK